MATIFVSPGIYTREQDFTVFASRIGITRLGIVGKFPKGPAFEVIRVSSTDEYALRFGGTSPDYPGSYVANSFLTQSRELNITRILGTTGFENSPAWLLVADKSTTYSGSVTESGMTLSVSNQPAITTWTVTTSANTSMANGTVSAATIGNNAYVSLSGSISTTAWLGALNTTSFSGYGITVVGNSTTVFVNSAGTNTITLTSSVVEPKGKYSGATLAVLRSKRNQISNQFYFTAENEIVLGGVTGALNPFVLTASTGPLTAVTNNGYTVSLDETRDDYIVKALGKSPKVVAGLPNLYVETIYPHFVRQALASGDIKGLNLSIVYSTEASYEDYNDAYTNSITPWLVSRVIGGEVKRLFRVQTISDGDASAKEIKISIANIDINNNLFDLIVRRFDDTDATATSTALERWSNVSMDISSPSYVAKVIGTTDESYPRRSNYITVDMSENHPNTTVPAGFEGFQLRGSGISGTTSPNIYYKTTYLSGDSKFKTFLGVSELGYTSFTQNQVSYKSTIKTVEADLFVFPGAESTGITSILGFHMENTANPAQFVSGDKNSLTAYTNTAGTLLDRNLLKFTLTPVGGFDGWDKYKQYENTYEEFTDAFPDNVQVFKDGIDTFSNPEAIDINIFATPGIDFSNNTSLINYALDMVETRTDSIYVIDSPRITTGTEKGTPEDLVARLESTGIDSNYAATYWPWIQIEDATTNQYSYQAPTLMVVRSMALTDNVAAPWVAPAGTQRGSSANIPAIIRADVKLKLSDRNTLYEGRVNPMTTLTQEGVVIYGQKTLQVAQSALDRINVRRLLLQIRRLVAAASQSLLFEQNDQTLRDQFLARVEPILLNIQNQRGLYAFKVIMDDTNNTAEVIDRNTLVGKIQLKPTKSVEFMDLTFQILPTGANFESF